MASKPGTVVCVCQDGRIVEGAVHYCVERSRRTGEALCLVMLLSDGNPEEVEEQLSAATAEIAASGVSADYQIYLGDKQSGLLKCLALRQGPATLVWGGETNVLNGERAQRREHWLSKVLRHLDCPVVFPAPRKLST